MATGWPAWSMSGAEVEAQHHRQIPTGRHLLKRPRNDIDDTDPRLPPDCELDYQADRAEDAYERTHLGWH